MKPVRIAAVAVLGLAAVALAGVGLPESAQGEEPKPGRTVTVTGSGTVESVPDSAQYSFGVVTEGADAKEALSRNATQMRRAIDALRKAGVDLRNVKTQYVSLNPRHADDGRTVIGYTATNTVSVDVDDIAKSGELVDAMVAAGVNQVSGPALTREDRDALYRQALEEAVTEARGKAQTLASAGDASVGQVVTMVEGAAGPPPIPYYGRAEAMAADAATPIQPGTEKIEASVTVTFALI